MENSTTVADQEILTLKEAAEFLRVQPHTMYYMLEHGQLRGRRVGKEYRFTRSALMAWLEADGNTAA